MAVFYALITVFCFTISNVSFRIAAQKEKNLPLLSVLYNLFATVWIIPIIVWEGSVRIDNHPNALFAITSIVGWVIFSYLVVWLNKKMDASTNAILYQATAVFSFIVAIIFLKESFVLLKVVGIALVVGGNISLYLGKTKLKFDTAFFARMFLNLVLALTYTSDSLASSHFSLGLYMLIGYSIPGLILWALVKDVNLKNLWKSAKQNFWPLVGISLPGVIGYFFLLKAYAIGDVSVLIPITSSNTITTVLASGLFLGERKNILKKVILAFIVFAGVVVLALVK